MTTPSHSHHASSCKCFLFASGLFCYVPANGNAFVDTWTEGVSVYADSGVPDPSNPITSWHIYLGSCNDPGQVYKTSHYGNSASDTYIALQSGNSASVLATSCISQISHPCGCFSVGMIIDGDDVEDYFATTTTGNEGTFTWTKPNNVANKDAVRDFTVTYYAFLDVNGGAYIPSIDDILLGTLNWHIKADTWWVESVEWVENPYGNGLFTEWTGKSIYADKDMPDASNQWTFVDVVVTVGGTLPSGGGTVTLAMIDPPNEYNGTYGDNNSDTFYFMTTQTLTFMPSQFVKTTDVSVGQNAGNNYIIKATPSSGEPFVESEKLTVWRRLWVECDAMPYFTEICNPLDPNWTPSDPCDVTFPPSPAGYLGLATSELARACVKPEVYSPNLNQPTVGHNPMTIADYLRVIGNNTTPGSGRDIYGNDPTSFWTVRIVMASKLDMNLLWPNACPPNTFPVGGFQSGYNTILIFNETVNESISLWKENHPTETVMKDDVIRNILLHEVCHLLIDSNEYNVLYNNGVFYDVNLLIPTMIDASMLGVRNRIQRIIPNPFGVKEVDIYHSTIYARLLVNDIQNIQFHSRARD